MKKKAKKHKNKKTTFFYVGLLIKYYPKKFYKKSFAKSVNWHNVLKNLN